MMTAGAPPCGDDDMPDHPATQPGGVSPFLQSGISVQSAGMSVILFLWLGSSVWSNSREVVGMIAFFWKDAAAT
jgi:hypothetical protein